MIPASRSSIFSGASVSIHEGIREPYKSGGWLERVGARLNRGVGGGKMTASDVGGSDHAVDIAG